MRKIAGGVPGRAGGQLGALGNDDVALAAFGKMIGGGDTDDAAADDGDAEMVAHPLPFQGIR